MTRQEFYEGAMAELKAIEQGQATVELVAGDILEGRVEYLTSRGWRIVVFSDGDDWDYVHSVISPSGQHYSLWPDRPEDDCEDMKRLRSYHPPQDQLTKIWGFLT